MASKMSCVVAPVLMGDTSKGEVPCFRRTMLNWSPFSAPYDHLLLPASFCTVARCFLA